MDQKILTLAERQAENKRKFDDTSRNNQNQQQPFKRNNVAQAYIAGPGEKKPYGGSKPMCPKCNYHHDGQCAPKCTKCKRIGHSAKDCKSQPAATNNQRAQGANKKVLTCFECGAQGHFKSNCPKLKNEIHQNRAGNSNVVARAYAVGIVVTNPNSNVDMGTFLLNNRYALILFDTGADRSFVSTAFSSLIDIIPTTLDHDYDVELADRRIGSFDIIIGMDCYNEHGSRLNIISFTKTQKYLLKGCHVFLAHVTIKKAEDKSEEKRLEDVPIVQDFPEVFP
ncbi:putative reverse transcriptase domain-containing protein [Tanacetum coccineum]